jgi:peptidoglycan/LPS O-acetylase OafA/YrhL
MATASTTRAYRPEIDGLRALAVVAVILNHFDKNILPGGFLGVDVFFVISGFVITASLAKRSDAKFSDFIFGFYDRRIRRLIPALAFCVLVTGVLICFVNPKPEASIWTGITSLFGLSNIYLFLNSTDYFSPSTQLNVFTHTWSLGVEEQFYVIFPVLAWFSSFSRTGSRRHRPLLWMLIALSLSSLLAFWHLNRTFPPAAYFLVIPRFWEIGSGCIVYLLITHYPGVDRFCRTLPPLLLLAGILYLFMHEVKTLHYVLLALLTCGLLSSLRPFTSGYRLLTFPVAILTGKISYSLYLWHWSILSLSRWTIGIHGWTIPIQLSLMLGMALFSYHVIETPLRGLQWTSSRRKTVLYGMGASGMAAGVLASIGLNPQFSMYLGDRRVLLAQNGQGLIAGEAPESLTSHWQEKNCVLRANGDVGKRIVAKPCTLGNFETAKRRVLVIGNSFSPTFLHGFDKLIQQDKFAVTITSAYGAMAVPGIKRLEPVYSRSNDDYWKRVVPGLVSQLRPGDWVVMASDVAEFSPKKRDADTESLANAFEINLRDYAAHLSTMKINLAFMDGIPFARDSQCEPVLAVKQWFHFIGQPCSFFSRNHTLARRSRLHGILQALEAEHRLRVINLFDVFCPGPTCTYEGAHGVVLYRDAFSHPSMDAARLSAPLIRTVLMTTRPAVPTPAPES